MLVALAHTGIRERRGVRAADPRAIVEGGDVWKNKMVELEVSLMQILVGAQILGYGNLHNT